MKSKRFTEKYQENYKGLSEEQQQDLISKLYEEFMAGLNENRMRMPNQKDFVAKKATNTYSNFTGTTDNKFGNSTDENSAEIRSNTNSRESQPLMLQTQDFWIGQP